MGSDAAAFSVSENCAETVRVVYTRLVQRERRRRHRANRGGMTNNEDYERSKDREPRTNAGLVRGANTGMRRRRREESRASGKCARCSEARRFSRYAQLGYR